MRHEASSLAAAAGSGSVSYGELSKQLDHLLAGESDIIANLANTASLVYHGLPNVNWAGFYLLRGNVLVLGPFQGKPACVRIEIGKGVCGTAVALRQTMRIPDVHAFPGHIACDVASASELVIPLSRGTELIGVLDLDSPVPARFDACDQAGCETLMSVLLRHIGDAAV